MRQPTISQVRPSRPQFPPGNVPKKPPLKPPPLRPPQRTPQPRPVAPKRGSVKPKAAPARDDRKPPPVVRLLRKTSPLGAAAAGLFADINPGDGTMSNRDMARLTDNKPSVQELMAWPPASFDLGGISAEGFEVTLKPTERPFVAPPLVPAPWATPAVNPDVVPEWSPEIPRSPAQRPVPQAPYAPGGSPVTRPRQRPGRVTGRPVKTHVERSITIQPVSVGPGQVGVRIKVRNRQKYERYFRTRRRYDAKGIYLRYQAFVTATFGTLTEVQDFVDSVAWNIVDDRGRPAMLLEREAAFGGRRVAKGDYLGAAVVNMRQYTRAFNGLASGKYSLDLGGAAADYTANQIGDWEAALPDRVAEKGFRKAGYSGALGQQGLRSMMEFNGWSINGVPSISGSDWARAQQKAVKGRVLWSKSRGVYSPRS